MGSEDHFQLLNSRFQLKQMDGNKRSLSLLIWNWKLVFRSGMKVGKRHSACEPVTSTSHGCAHTTLWGIT